MTAIPNQVHCGKEECKKRLKYEHNRKSRLKNPEKYRELRRQWRLRNPQRENQLKVQAELDRLVHRLLSITRELDSNEQRNTDRAG